MPVLQDDIIKYLTFICVPNCQKATLDELSILLTRFPNVIPQEDMTHLGTERFEYEYTSEKEIPSWLNENKTANRIDFTWNEIAKLVKFLLLIPHSNAYCAYCGSIFSTVKKICTGDRHKEGQASTSVYQSTTGIRNNLVSLLITKVNIFLKHCIKCYEWKPSGKVVKSTKSVRYKNLTLRKDTEDDK